MPQGKGLCRCGCGQPTNLADRTAASRGWIKGKPIKYLFGHYRPHGVPPNFKGRVKSLGYVLVHMPEHPEATVARPYVQEHRLIMEQHLGRRLKRTEIVHHINHIRDDNRIENLQVMDKREHDRFHMLALRKRQRDARNNQVRTGATTDS